jgi:tetratricopeptide (TPR) repeat protein
VEKLSISYRTTQKALPPRPIKVSVPGWAGTQQQMTDGADAQPWHCLPFVEGSTYGLELLYEYETECHVVNDNGVVRFEWDYAREPDCVLSGGEFILVAPLRKPRYYLFSTRIDLKAPPGYVLRTEPHPRFFTDDTGTVPLAMIAHLQTEWRPKNLVVGFKAPQAGQRHIFRKGEPFAQILLVPRQVNYELTRMSKEEGEERAKLERAMDKARLAIADKTWQNSDGAQMDNHYKVLARTFAQRGMPGVDNAVRLAGERQELALEGKSIAECLAWAAQLMNEKKQREAMPIFSHVLRQDPNQAEALNGMGICLACGTGSVPLGLEMMVRATQLQPLVPKYFSTLGEVLRLLGRHQEAESAFRSSLQLNTNDPVTWSLLGLALAQQGRAEEGLQACRAALATGVPLPAAHFCMGRIQAQQRQFAQARASFENALALDPAFGDARRALNELPALN